jgi:hypothetical protein
MDGRAGAKIPVPKRQAWGVEDSTPPTRQLFDYGYALCIENRHTNFPEIFLAPFFYARSLLLRALLRPAVALRTSEWASPICRPTNLVYLRLGRERQVIPDLKLLPELYVLRDEYD